MSVCLRGAVISLLVLSGVFDSSPARAEDVTGQTGGDTAQAASETAQTANEAAQSANEAAPTANETPPTANKSGFNPFAPCPKCKLLLGAGQTYQFWGWSDGVVLPVTLELDESRWELGAFRVATRQIAIGHGYPPPDYTSAPPFWGYSAMRRWQFLHRSWLRLYAGVGGSYKTEIDTLDATRWNFSYLLAARFDLGSSGSLFEIAVRHWSNAYIKRPNIGENFLTLSFSY